MNLDQTTQIDANPSTDTRQQTRLSGQTLVAARGLWVILALVTVALYITSLPIYFDQLRTPTPDAGFKWLYPYRLFPEDAQALLEIGSSATSYATYLSVIWSLEALVLAGAGVIIFWRRSDDGMVIFTSSTLIMFGSINAASPPTALLSGDIATFRFINFWLIFSTSAALCLCFIFPNGHFVPRWTFWLGLAWLMYRLISVIAPHTTLDMTDWPSLMGLTMVIVVYGCGVYAQIYRFRNVATPIQRQQTKRIVYGFVAVFSLTIVSVTGVTILFPSSSQPGLPHVLFNVITQTSFVLGLTLWAISIAFSALRYRLWNIDLTVNRSLVYGAVTLALGILFVALFWVAQALLGMILGTAQSGAAVAVSAALTAVAFNPARKQVQSFVDHSVYGFRFDLNELKAARQEERKTNPGALTGQTLGDYEVLGVLGKGGMGEVYQGQARDTIVAIKILPPELAQREELRIRFQHEAKILASFDHPNIVKLYGTGENNGMHYMVLEYVEGRELSDIIREQGRLTLDEARVYCKHFAAALDYAHQRGLIHRDIKPSNIMIRTLGPNENQAVLMDFGIAKLQNARTRVTGTGVIGTLDYMAPEQIMASGEVDARADIYAMGVVLYEMLTGQKPFRGNTGQILFAHLQQPAPDPRTIVPDLQSSVALAVMQAMAKKPEERFSTAGEFAAALG
jgi:predicted Ser/Thr protein kinase